MRIKAGVYFSHYECLGHTSRVMAVGEVFKKRFPEGNLFFIQAGVAQPKAKIDQLGKVYPLPKAFMDRRHFREPIHGAGIATAERSQLCADIIASERPDLLMTEFFPLGREECRHELMVPLIKASVQGAVLWAVAGYPLLTGADDQWRQNILKLYQQIIIFSPSWEKDIIADSFAQAYDKKKYLEFFESNAQKIRFAGYLLPQQEVVQDDEDVNRLKPPIPKGACRVAVVRGGGAYYPKLIAEAILASDLLGEEYYLTVVAGPSTTTQEWYFFNTLLSRKKVNNVLLLRSVGDYEGLIKGSDLCVSVAAYHTSVMLLKHRKKSILIPFEGHGSMTFREQPARAVILKEMIGAKVLSIKELSADVLAATIRKTAASPHPASSILLEAFMGADVLDEQLTRLFPR